MIRLGPFQLQRALGQGGMGRVWLAHHGLQREAVAVKVLSPELALDDRALRAFRREVRAAAGLDHPAIVSVFDYGEVDGAAAQASQGQLTAGSPYLVMELASQGSLHAHCGRLDWATSRGLLMALLDALAHAHARGVIHRDLKPANVLLAQESSGSVVKLSDFGLAHALGGATGERYVAGTPSCMAPEQFRASWRDYGPWTDLYALGVLAWELVCGQLPLQAQTIEGWRDAHLRDELCDFVPAFPVPEGLESWLRRLLQKRSWDRFQRAADAAWALARLELSEGQGRGQGQPGPAPATFLVSASRSGRSALTWMEAPAADTLVPEMPAATWEDGPSLGLGQTICPREPPPAPADWRRPRAGRLRLHGVGRGLYGLRSLQLVGRERELDQAWGLLHQTLDEGRPRALVLRGGAGVGKSRLATWIAERAHEVGAGLRLSARHAEQPGPGLGLVSMLERQLHLVGLDELALRRRIEDSCRHTGALDPDLVEARVALLRPELSGVRLSTPLERHVVLRRWMRQLARALFDLPTRGRAVVLVLDDVQWGPESLAFAQYLLQQELPALVLLTVREDQLGGDLAAQLEELLEHEHAHQLRLGPLDAQARRVLVRQLLGLSGGLADEVEERSSGNPLFAVELVGDLVERGVLQLGEGGFQLGPGERIQLPDDLFEVWGPRVRSLAAQLGPEGELALELAAALGQEVRKEEWRGLCAAHGVELERTRAVQEDLARLGLVQVRPKGFVFTHGILVEALRRHAAEGGRLRSHHAACAAWIQARHPEQAERIGRHLLQAEAWAQALGPLAAAAEALRDRGEFVSCHRVLDRREAALASLGEAASAREQALGWVLRATAHRMQGEWEAFESLIAPAVRVARQVGDEGLLGDALRGRAEAERQRGRLDAAGRQFEEAAALLVSAGDQLGEARCLQGLADVARQQHRLEEAVELYGRALELYRDLNDLKGMGGCHRGLGGVFRLRRDYPAAARSIERAHGLFERNGLRLGVANSLNDLGDFARYRGAFDESERLYRRAEATYRACGSYAVVYPLTNLGLLFLQEARFDEARRTVAEALEQARVSGIVGLLGGLWLCVATCDASEGRWSDFDRAFARAVELLRRSGDFDRDNILPAEQAAEHCLAKAQSARAGACLQLALEQAQGLGDPAAIQRLGARLQALDEGFG